MDQPADQRGRGLRDLRISLTDRCNMRCTYCMPKEVFGPDFRYLPSHEILTFEEITSLVRSFVQVGVSKVRLTGGEPLLRKDISSLVRELSRVNGLDDLALTTNGVLLPRFADQLKKEGLSRITVSLDSLDDEVFSKINNRGYKVADVLAGIEAAQQVGLPVKVNMVVERGVNDHEVVEMAKFFKSKQIIVRFIEFMDVGNFNDWNEERVVPSAEIIDAINQVLPVQLAQENYLGEVARRYVYESGGGEFGVISSISNPFCGDCHRARLSAKGEIYTCLFAQHGFSLRDLLRSGKNEGEIATTISRLWLKRDNRYSEKRAEEGSLKNKVEMSYIGG